MGASESAPRGGYRLRRVSLLGDALLRARQLCAIDLFGLSREIVEVGE